MYSYLFAHATVIDGTGSERYVADVALDGDRIAAIGSLDPSKAERVIDARGMFQIGRAHV